MHLYSYCILTLSLLFSAFGYSQTSQKANLVGKWSDSTLVGSWNHNNAYNEIWGLAVNGSEFAVIGSTAGTHFINLADPTNLSETFFVAGAVQGGEIIHRDYHDHNGYLYAVADEGAGSTLQIIDISDLPNSLELVYDSGEFSVRTHNIFIDTTAQVMYMCKNSGTNLDRLALRLLDISDPLNPVLLYTMTELPGFGAISTVHDAYAENNVAYLNLGTQGFAIVDFSDLDNINLLGSLTPNDYPQSGYNHSGYPTEDQNYYYLADETYGKDIKAMDLRNLPDIITTDTIDALSLSPYSIPHNQIVHDGFLYSSYYYDGLQVYDLTDPLHPTNVFHYPTSQIPHRNRYEGAWGVYPFLPSGLILVSDMQEGLVVLRMEASTSVEDDLATANTLMTSPNPTYGSVHISLGGQAFADGELVVLSQNGTIVYQQATKVGTTAYDLELDLPIGMYLVQYKTTSHCQTTKLLIGK